jgi:hypothetical protein
MKAVLLLAMSLVVGGERQGLTIEQQYSVPEWAERVFQQRDFGKSYVLDAHLNPFCLRADFDGDGKADFAVFVREKSSNKIGIAFVHQGTGKFYVVGAGRKIPDHGDDLSWVDAWIVFDKGPVSQGADETPPPRLKGDALLIFKTEAASARLWWTGSTYRWYQQGD